MGENAASSELVAVVKGKLANTLSLAIGGEVMDDVLISIFYDKETDKSAICPLLIDTLNDRFDDYTGRDQRCTIGNKARCIEEVIELTPLGTFTGQNVTSLLLMTVKDDNVLVVGTSSGDVLKIVLRDQGNGGITLTTRSLLLDPILKLTASDTVMYGSAGTRVFGEPLGRCENFATCEECAAGGDPFCGWCLLKAR